MADGLPITPGSGATVATDDIAGFHYQKVKLALGDNDAAVLASAGAGNVDGGTPRFTLADDDPVIAALTVLGAMIGADDLTRETDPTVPAALSARLAGNQDILAQLLVIQELFRDATDPAPVVAPGTVLTFTPVLDTVAYADGDVLFITTALAGAFRADALCATVDSILVLDENDQGIAHDLVFLDANNSIGTLNAAVSITAANARAIVAIGGPATAPPNPFRFNVADYVDLGVCKVAQHTGIGKKIKAAAASTTLHIAGIARGAGTFTASGLKYKIGLTWD